VRAVQPAPAASARVRGAARLSEARALDDCASCHPRQAAEWSRSVMAHAATSPLFGALEMLIEEQVGRDRDCPGGAGILRSAGDGACRSPTSGLPVTGSGGELWCVNCHAPGANLGSSLPPWNGRSNDPSTRRPLRDLLPPAVMEGIGCAACHQAIGPAHPGNQAAGLYEGNPTWLSPDSGRRFSMRPEDARGLPGISNSGYFLRPGALLARPGVALVRGGSHAAMDAEARRYLASSEFCGACHDVRLFGTDALAGRRGEHFKRLRNAYSEWAAWSEDERRAGRAPASCQDCHMSLYPGVCVPSARVNAGDPAGRACPPGTAFEPRPPGTYGRGRAAAGAQPGRVASHYFSGVDVPLGREFDAAAIDDTTLDVAGIPLGARQRRDLLLARTFQLTLDGPRRDRGRIEIPVVIENVGAGHRVPAGFSQEREFWIHLRVTDAAGRVVYEVGRVDRGDQDLADKVFLRVNTADDTTDGRGRPLGLFGADVADGPDHPRWSPPPALGGTVFRGRGLVNFQNGFLRCVRCIGRIDRLGRCQPGPGQQGHRAARYADAEYDTDSGACRSNLRGAEALFETYFPIGALDAERGLVKGPDAIVDTRSAPPGQPLRYVYDLEAGAGPLTVEARLLFRAFPPFLLRAFIDYEARQHRRGLRPSGPLIDSSALDRLDVVEIAVARARIPGRDASAGSENVE
jgi:eukaryotic-like serine/threonine-protein kinase